MNGGGIGRREARALATMVCVLVTTPLAAQRRATPAAALGPAPGEWQLPGRDHALMRRHAEPEADRIRLLSH